MKPKNQRLVLVIAAIAAVLVAVMLAMWGLQDRAAYFYTPADIAAGKAPDGQAIRLGGMVEKGSIQRQSDGVTIRFLVTDGKARDAGRLSRHRPGPVPRRSGRGRGGAAWKSGTFVADTILAKHDERYMPPELGNLAAEHKAGKTLQRNDRGDGLAALWLAAGLAALPALADGAGLAQPVEVGAAMRAVAVVQGALTLIAFATLLLVFARTDLSVALVFENSHSAKPFIYKVAGAWGNHEGSMLLWVTVLSVAGRVPRLVLAADQRADVGRRAWQPGGAGARLLCLPADRLEPVRAARSRRRSEGRGSIPCSRTRAWPSIRRPSTSAMSGCRSRSASRSARC